MIGERGELQDAEIERVFERLHDEVEEARGLEEVPGVFEAILWALNVGVTEGIRQEKAEAESRKGYEDVEG